MLPPGIVPRYLGSWSFQLTEPIPEEEEEEEEEPGVSRSHRQPRTRAIRLVLLEPIRGCSMESLKITAHYEDYDETYRLYVLARILEIDIWLDHIGVLHQDIADRNIMMDPPPEQHDPAAALLKPRVVFIDFGMADVIDPEDEELKPLSPVKTWWKHRERLIGR